jgi:hypothetical protein
MPRPKKILGKSSSDTQATSTLGPVNPQIREMSGFSSLEELKKEIPESTGEAGEATKKERRKRRTKAEIEAERGSQPAIGSGGGDLMDDPEYRAAVQEMVGFGSPRLVKTPFKLAAKVLDKPDMDLDKKEEKRIDGFFYVVGKRTNLDPTRSTWMLALYGIVMILELVLTRVWLYNSASMTNEIAKMLGFDLNKKEKEPEGEHIQ